MGIFLTSTFSSAKWDIKLHPCIEKGSYVMSSCWTLNMTSSEHNFSHYTMGSLLLMIFLVGEKRCYPGFQSRAQPTWYHLERYEDILKRHFASPLAIRLWRQWSLRIKILFQNRKNLEKETSRSLVSGAGRDLSLRKNFTWFSQFIKPSCRTDQSQIIWDKDGQTTSLPRLLSQTYLWLSTLNLNLISGTQR